MNRLVAGLVISGTAFLVLAGCHGLKDQGVENTAAPPPTFIVFFEGRSTDLTADGQKIVAAAAKDARSSGVTMVQVSGPSTQVTPHYDPGLAEPRIKLVEDELKAKGVPKNLLVRTSLPTDKVLVTTSGAQRVEIRVLK